MRLSALFFAVFLCLNHVFGQAALAPTLSDSATISLWTVEPGNELYSIFGHSALQVRDEGTRINKVYNYGTFEFDNPNFYSQFVQGKLPYYLNIEAYRQFEYGNLYDRRTMTEQVLNLDNTERQRLFQLLETNSEEQNKYYRYEFFYDNCATRIRDIIQAGCYETLNWDSSHVDKKVTMRHLLHEHLKPQPWAQFGIDLVLGARCDKKPTPDEYQFLPKYLHDVVGKTKKQDGTPLVSKTQVVKPPKPKENDLPHPYSSPLVVMSIIAIIGILSMFHVGFRRIFDWMFWISLFLVGLLMAGLWFFTDHQATKVNLNLIWAFPLHIFFFAKRKTSEWAENYFLALGMVCLVLLLCYIVLPQQLPLAILPILLMMVVKCFFMRFEARV
jgi:small basic protein